MKFDPATGEPKPYPSHAGQWRKWRGDKIAWLFDPWTGMRRDARDVGSDVAGLLIVPAGTLGGGISCRADRMNACAPQTENKGAAGALLTTAPTIGDKTAMLGSGNETIAPLTNCEAQIQELLFAVEIKHPGETRFETALRYIREAEKISDGNAVDAVPEHNWMKRS